MSESAKVNIRELLTYWLWRANPPTITVTATACSGSKDATIKVFPHKKYEFAVSMGRSAQKKSDSSKAGKDPIDVFKATLMAIKRTTDVASKVAKLAGEKLQIKLMQGFVFKWEIEYKENTETKGWYRAKKYTPATVGRDWTITFAAKPIIGVDASISFSLLNLVVPCMGQTVGTLLRKARIVRADVVFAAMIGMYANIQFGKDEYDYPKFKGVNIGVDATLSMALVFGTAGIDVLELKAAFPCNFNNNFNTSKKKGCLIAWTPKFTARSNFTLTIFPDRWWEIEAAHASPSWLRIQWPRVPKPIDLFTAPG